MPSINSNNGNPGSTDDKPSAPVFFGPERPPHGPASQAAADAAQASKEKEEDPLVVKEDDPLCVALREMMKSGGMGPGGFVVGV
ncbi:Ff.00g038500.m01.CDS01 [Fusarium sp. VM40]|nr:Ff.00g038500.m01.CDS01 [Fusarium sp. VM40]